MDEHSPSAYQPKLTRWGHTWRLLLMLILSGLGWSETILGQWRDQPYLLVVEIVLGLAGYVLVFYRRSSPLPVALLLAVFGTFSALAAGPALLAAVSLATRRVYWQILVVAAANIVSGQAYVTLQPIDSPDPVIVTLTANVAVIAAFLAWGMYVGSRRELLWTLRRRAEEAESDQESRMTQARLAERARIAREMHDVLAHRISHISLQSGALSFREDLSADEIRTGVGLIQERANEALNDLRGVLGVLRDETTGAPLNAPQPTYADVAGLVDQSRSTGQQVFYDVQFSAADRVPDAVGRTLYRVVQEGLTNAAKHAPGTMLTITLSGSPQEGVELAMTNPFGFHTSLTPGAGLGLVGVRERLEIRGGRLEAGSAGSHFNLRAWLPWTP